MIKKAGRDCVICGKFMPFHMAAHWIGDEFSPRHAYCKPPLVITQPCEQFKSGGTIQVQYTKPPDLPPPEWFFNDGPDPKTGRLSRFWRGSKEMPK